MTTTQSPTLSIAEVVAGVRRRFDEGITRPLEWRRDQLRAMQRMLRENEDEIVAAIKSDSPQPFFETWAVNVASIAADIGVILKNLDSWTGQSRVSIPLIQMPARARIVREPLGVVLVIAPWNYPVQLLLGPMAGAIAAGNAVVGKPSEITANTSRVIAELVPRYLDNQAIAIVEGSVPETTELLAQRYDHIFYTGNSKVARVVMTAAAAHLTPVTLELGGKSPVIVDADANLVVTARRLAWGKFLNAGQTCVCPDHVFAHKSIIDPLLDQLAKTVTEFYGDDPKASPDFARIVSTHHTQRLARLLEGEGRGEIVFGGEIDEAQRYVAPTALRGTRRDSPIMQEEIFGPILPVMEISNIDEAIGIINEGEKPLALYVFSKSRKTLDKVVAETTSGGVCANGALYQVGVPGLPFGGVGESGMGAYHGRQTVEIFQHHKSYLAKPTWIDPKIPYPPYTSFKEKLLRRFL